MRILVIEDDTDIRNQLVTGLRSESFAVDEALDGEKGSYLARVNCYDLVMLDIGLPKKNGIEVCKEIRLTGKIMPIIIISINPTPEQKVVLLNSGADDYISKPFSYFELMARVRALLRRPQKIEADVLELDDLRVDTQRQKVSRGEKPVYLTRKEFSLLEYLMKNIGYVVSRGMIMEHVWDASGDPFSNTIEAHILNIRKKIDSTTQHKLIHTIPGRGYKIDIA